MQQKIKVYNHSSIQNLIIYFMRLIFTKYIIMTHVSEDTLETKQTLYLGHSDDFNVKNDKKFNLLFQKGMKLYYREIK